MCMRHEWGWLSATLASLLLAVAVAIAITTYLHLQVYMSDMNQGRTDMEKSI